MIPNFEWIAKKKRIIYLGEQKGGCFPGGNKKDVCERFGLNTGALSGLNIEGPAEDGAGPGFSIADSVARGKTKNNISMERLRGKERDFGKEP